MIHRSWRTRNNPRRMVPNPNQFFSYVGNNANSTITIFSRSTGHNNTKQWKHKSSIAVDQVTALIVLTWKCSLVHKALQ
jgi:hypothetical protein